MQEAELDQQYVSVALLRSLSYCTWQQWSSHTRCTLQPGNNRVVDGDVANVDHSINAAGMLLSSMSRKRDRRKDGVNSAVLAAEAK